MADQDDTSEPTAPASLEVAVAAGDAEEDLAALLRLRDELLEHYQPTGRVEELLVDRIVGLQWRLRRVQRAERGLIGDRTRDVLRKRRVQRHDDGDEEVSEGLWGNALMRSSNHHALAHALGFVTELRQQVRGKEKPDVNEARVEFNKLFGFDEDDWPTGKAASMLVLLNILNEDGRCIENVNEEQRTRRVQKIRRELVRDLGEVERALVTLHDIAKAIALAGDAAAVEAKSLPQAHDLQALSRYEQHLIKTMEVAETTLRKEQARRRLRTAIVQSYRDRWH